MDDKTKGFWKYFSFLVAGAALNLCGALIGKTIVGFILYGFGLAVVITVAILIFLKKDYFKNGQLKILILAAILGVLLAAGVGLLVAGSAATAAPAGFSGQMPSGTMPSGNFPSGGQMPSGGNFPGNNSNSTDTSNRGSWSANSTGGTFPGGSMSSHSSSSKSATRVIGWISLGVGAAFLVFLVILLLTKRLDLKGDHWKVALLGFIVMALIVLAAVLMFVKPSASSFPAGMQAPGGQQQASLPQNGTSTETAAATEQATENATETVTPVPSVTNTPEPTATATVETYDKLVVCLNYDIQVGINIRDFPDESGRNVGTIPMAGCFTIDGKNSHYEGWYHLASGQNGIGGITISSRFADSENLWVKGDNFLISKDKLALLNEVPVTPDATATPAGK